MCEVSPGYYAILDRTYSVAPATVDDGSSVLFTDWFNGVFKSMLWPILGFLFLPLTTLWYSAVQHWFGGNWDVIPIVGLVVALLVDLSPTRYRRRRREVVVV